MSVVHDQARRVAENVLGYAPVPLYAIPGPQATALAQAYLDMAKHNLPRLKELNALRKEVEALRKVIEHMMGACGAPIDPNDALRNVIKIGRRGLDAAREVTDG